MVPPLFGLVNLTSLNIEGNKLQAVPSLPEGLTSVIMNFNNISSIGSLPSTLLVAEFRANFLVRLPALPPSLQTLKVGRNVLLSIPPLPSSLRYLSCYSNSLSSLPELPPTMEILYASENPIGSLPASLANATRLQELEVAHCGLSEIPAFMENFSQLRYLQASRNRLSEIPRLFAGPQSKVERLLLADNLLTLKIEWAVHMISTRHPQVFELDLSFNNLGGSLSMDALLAISIEFQNYGARLPKLRLVSLRKVNMSGAVFFSLFKDLWPVVEAVDFRDNPELITFPLSQEQSLISVDVRGCKRMGPFLRNASRVGSFAIDKFTYLVHNSTTIRAAPVSRYILDQNKGDVACPETLEAGLIRRFGVIVDPSGTGYSSALGCRCQKGTFGVPDVDADAGCVECSGLFDAAFLKGLSGTNYLCDDGSRLIAHGAWPFVMQSPVKDWAVRNSSNLSSTAAVCPFVHPDSRDSEWKLGLVPCPRDSNLSPCAVTEVRRAPPRRRVCHDQASYVEEVRRYMEGLEVKCADGHEGRFCSRCQEGYYKTGRTCTRCSVGVGLTALLVSLLAFVGFCVRLLLRINTRSRGIARIFIMHLQLLGSLVSVININMPAGARSVISSLEWLTSLSFSGVECLATRAFGSALSSAREFAPFIASVAMPVVAGLVAVISVYIHFAVVWAVRVALDLYDTWKEVRESGGAKEGQGAAEGGALEERAVAASLPGLDLGAPALSAAASQQSAAVGAAVAASASFGRSHSKTVSGPPASTMNRRRFSLHPLAFGNVQREAAIAMVSGAAPDDPASPMPTSGGGGIGRRRTNSDSPAGAWVGRGRAPSSPARPQLGGADETPAAPGPPLGRRGAVTTIIFRAEGTGGSGEGQGAELKTSFKDRIVICFTYIWLIASFRALRKISSAFGCSDYGTGSDAITYLSDHLWVECSWSRNSVYRTLVVSAAAMLVLYVVITLVLLVVLFGRKEVPETHRTTLIIRRLLEGPYRFGRLTKSWECVQLARRFAFALIHGLSPYNSPVLSLGISSVLLVSISLHLWFRPFKSVIANTIEMASMTILLASYATWQVVSLGTLSYSAGSLGFALLVANVAFLVVVFVVLSFLQMVSMRSSQAAVTYFTSECSETMSATWADDRFLNILSPLAQPSDMISTPASNRRSSMTSVTSKNDLQPNTPSLSPRHTVESMSPGDRRHQPPAQPQSPARSLGLAVTFFSPTPSPRTTEPQPDKIADTEGAVAIPALLSMDDALLTEMESEVGVGASEEIAEAEAPTDLPALQLL